MKFASDLHDADGLAQMQAILDGGLEAPIARILDFDLIAIKRGYAEFEGRISRLVYNSLGMVHGGYAATILDTACGGAAHTCLSAGQGFMTLELKISYHRPLFEESAPVQCIGTTVSIDRGTAFTRATLTDAQGNLCASATSTLLIFEIAKSNHRPTAGV